MVVMVMVASAVVVAAAVGSSEACGLTATTPKMGGVARQLSERAGAHAKQRAAQRHVRYRREKQQHNGLRRHIQLPSGAQLPLPVTSNANSLLACK